VSDPLRVTFVGRASEVGHAVPAAPVDGLHPSFVEQRAGGTPARLLAHIAEHAPGVVVVFGVDSMPAAAVRAIDAPVLAWAVAPDRPPGLECHPELPQSAPSFAAERARPRDYARVIDRPLPVADELFSAPRRPPGPPRAVVVGHGSPRNERLLIDSKHRHELLHIASGLRGDALAAVLAGAVAAINVRDDDAPGFGPRVALYLAAGLLLVTEPLHPPHGLQPGRDHVEIRSSDELVELLGRVRANPDDFTVIREAGRRKAEAFRASRVYLELLAPFAPR
jgi:glycosyl transferase family 1